MGTRAQEAMEAEIMSEAKTVILFFLGLQLGTWFNLTLQAGNLFLAALILLAFLLLTLILGFPSKKERREKAVWKEDAPHAVLL